MSRFVLLTDKEAGTLTRMVLLSKQHISEIRSLNNPVSDGAIVVMGNGRELRTSETFDELLRKLHEED